MTYPQQIFSAFAFLGFLLAIIPLPWHLEVWNTGTCLYMVWTAMGCLNLFINSVIWRGNAINWAPAWCEISSRITIAVGIAIPAASLCINRRLYHIASVRSVTISKAEKRRDVIIDLAIGLGLPLIYEIFYIINQGHRFNIYEDVGCWPFAYNTVVAEVLLSGMPLIVGLVSAYYSIRSILCFNKSRHQFNELLSSHSNLTSSRYLRLMCLAGIEVLGTIPFVIASIIINTRAFGIRKWISWENTHSFFNRVDQYPSVIWRANPIYATQFELCRWMTIACAFIFFGFFGFADEARIQYRRAVQSITKTLGLSLTLTSTSNGGILSSDAVFKSKTSSSGKLRPVPPIHVHKDMFNSRSSIMSIDASFRDVGGLLSSEKSDDEKSSTFAPTLSYGAMTLNDAGGTLSDVGGTLPGYSESPISPVSSSGPSSLSTPALTRENSIQNIEISSLRRVSVAPISPVVGLATPEKAHTADVV